jgi:thiol-disulfide isomerase/thioredoxin
MAAVHSTMRTLETLAPAFNLPDTRQINTNVSLYDLSGKPMVVMFICNHCPYVIHIVERLVAIGNYAVSMGFGVVAINANDAQAYPQDGPEEMAKFAREYGFDFPYLFDQSQSVAHAYAAACTPDFYVYDAAHRLKYRGQMDGSRPGSLHDVTGDDLSAAINAVHRDERVNPQQTPSIGCNIKWQTGNEPDYF